METILKILDTGLDYYNIEPAKVVLGRQYDNNADSIRIEIPKQELDSLCTMIITNQIGQVIDHIPMKNREYLISSAISQNKIIKIGFSFSRKDGYVKNSAIIFGQFLEAQKPDDFVPVQSEQKKSIDYLIEYGFTDSKLVDNELQFFNANGEKVVAFDLSPFVQEQSDLGETDETRETFVKGKKTSNLINDGESGKSPYATQEYINNKISEIKKSVPYVFDTYQHFIDWLAGTYIREDGSLPKHLKLGDDILIAEQDVADYWVKSISSPMTINDFAKYETGDYYNKAEIDEKLKNIITEIGDISTALDNINGEVV